MLSAVAAADRLASAAGVSMFDLGGNAVDAVVAAGAVMAVTSPHLNGMGGDLFALVYESTTRTVIGVAANGAAGSGADPDNLRAAGFQRVPRTDHIAATPIPGCVDGWLLLLERFGRLEAADVLEPARRRATDGFPASPGLAFMTTRVADRDWARNLTETPVTRPGVARALRAIVHDGRDGFYLGEFGRGLSEMGDGEFTAEDLATNQARIVEPIYAEAWGTTVWTVPPPSQGYLVPASAAIAAGCDLPSDPDDPRWAHLLVEASRVAAFDRLDVLHERADGRALLDPDRLAARRSFIGPRALDLPIPADGGGTTYLCAVDRDRMAVSLIQSNASGFGSGLAEPNTGINLQSRGLGFSLQPGHPAEYGPGRRPPHTLSPALVTNPDGTLNTVLGTMGGDAQPQIVLQLLARLLVRGETPEDAVSAGRFRLASIDNPLDGFAAWDRHGQVVVEVEGNAPDSWIDGLAERGHAVQCTRPLDSRFGHAHAITVTADGSLAAAADPRSEVSGVEGR